MSLALGGPVAEKKPKASAKKSVTGGRKPTVVQMRGSEEWKEWVERLAKSERDTVSKLFDRLVTKFAADKGFEPPPDR